MADGRAQNPASSDRSASWMEIFRCFQVALDPRKLLVAAVGILVMSFMWWLLSVIFYSKAPETSEPQYQNSTIQRELGDKKKPDGTAYTEEDFRRIAHERYSTDMEQWRVLDSLAGPGGRLRTMPWYEYRGPNPFLFVTDVLSGSANDRATALTGFFSGSVPVLIEPLVKMLIPVAKLISPGVSVSTRIYLFLILMCNIAVWAFCAGIITRLAAVQLANKGPISLKQATRFVCKRYTAYLGAPLVPLIIIAACVVGLIAYGVLGLIPVVGDLLIFGLGLPVIIVGGAVMAVFLVGLVGYPLMYTTLSAEGDQSDTFDALSRSINYVYQSPWHYIWYWLVAIFYGAAVTLFILFFCSLTVYVGKWAVGLTASTVWTDRKPEYLFIYAPESFGWKELLTKDSPYAVRGSWDKIEGASDRQVYTYRPADPVAYAQARSEFYSYNSWGAGIVCFWLTLMFLMMLGFSYSFFWTAATVIYFLMRKKVDEAELDEVFLDDEEPEVPPAPPKIAEGTGAQPSPMTSLPVITAPAPAVAPAPVPPPPLPPIPVVDLTPPAPAPAPATIPITPPATEEPKKPEGGTPPPIG
ncbi:MAG: hypothetical protein C0467_15220 [Planctomycetaceae bacterium]|nr:hypothetical protein [Planctomycetaceae bacterium]